jgi:hypothetical protein
MSTGPISNNGAGGAWQNPVYPVINSTSLYVPNQGLATTTQFQPTSLVPAVLLGGAGPQSALEVVQVSAYSAYEIGMSLFEGTPGVAGEICQVDIYWWDQLGDAVPVEHIRFEAPVLNSGTGPGTNTWGHGPMAGQWMAIVLTNQTGGGDVFQGTFSFTGTTRDYTTHDWRSDGGISSVAGSSAQPYSNELCVISAATIGASGGSQSRQMFLYSGQALFHSANLQANGTLEAVIQDSAGHEIVQLHPPENGAQDELIELPRRLCTVVVTNIGAAATTANISILADRP